MYKSLMTTAACAIVCATSASAATVVNGSFEASTDVVGLVNGNNFDDLAGSTRSSSWDVWNSLDGWASQGAGIEIQTNGTLGIIDAQDGEHYVELASHGLSNSNSLMAQALDFSAGSYLLSFYYSPRTNVVGENGINFGIEGVFDDAVSGPSDSRQRGEWSEVTYEFTIDSDMSTGLFFSAVDGGSSTLGGLIDNVSISAVPLPASAALLLAGLGGLGAMRRRQKA